MDTSYIYIDQLFVFNFVVDYVLLLITKRVVKARTGRVLLLCGAFVGAVYAVLAYIPALSFMYSMPGKIAFTLLLVAVVYGFDDAARYIRTLGMFYVVNFAFAGAVYAVMGFTGNLALLGGGMYYNLPMRIIGISAIVAYFALSVYSWFAERAETMGNITQLDVTIDGKTVTLPCLADSGNTLHDPISSLPVVVAEYAALKDILPHCVDTTFGAKDDLGDFGGDTRLRFIPFNAVGTKNGVLPGIKPDAVTVHDNGCTLHAVIAIYDGNLSSDGNYNGLINPKQLQTATKPLTVETTSQNSNS